MSEPKRAQVAKAICAVANPGMGPETLAHFEEPYRVWLPTWPNGFLALKHEPRPLWQYFLPMADRAIVAMGDGE